MIITSEINRKLSGLPFLKDSTQEEMFLLEFCKSSVLESTSEQIDDLNVRPT